MAGTVTCTPLPDQGGLRVFIDWNGAAEPDDHLKVERLVTGMPPVLVRPAYAPTEPISTVAGYRDTFTRIVASMWGNPDLGPPWTVIGTAANYSADGSEGVHSVPAAGQTLSSQLPISLADVDLRVQVRNVVVPTGGSFEFHVRARYIDDQNFVDVQLSANTTNDFTITVRQRINNVDTVSASASVFGVLSTTRMIIRLRAHGSFLAAKAWAAVNSEPVAWNAQLATTHLVPGKVQLRSVLTAGVTNVGPVLIRWDNLSIAGDPAASLDSVYHVTTCSQLVLWDFEAPMDVPVSYRVTAEPSGETVTTTACVFASGGNPWLKDPLSPCHNIKLAPCRTTCPEPDAVLWLGHEQEQYAAVSAQFEVVGRRRPVEVSQWRRDAVTTVHFATITCAARDKLLDLTRAGTPVFIPRFDEVCWPDRYLSLGDHAVIPLSRDLRRTERVHSFPAVVVDAPPGPICCTADTSWCDLCSCADTWNEMDALGLTGLDVLEGEAVEGAAC